MSCSGCMYVNFRADEWPCCDCIRIERTDMYEESDQQNDDE